MAAERELQHSYTSGCAKVARTGLVFAMRVTRTYYTWVLFIAILLFGCYWILRPPYAGREYEGRLGITRLYLNTGRHSIAIFAEKVGRYPHSLNELCEYDKKFPRTLDWQLPLRESISNDDYVRSVEHATLNGKGGFFYDRTTGTLKVNLTRPIKYYWWFYFGKARSEVPADW